MDLVLITGHYPYGMGETFVEDEMKIAEKFFDKITILSGEKKPKDECRYVPKNSNIICFRKKRYEFFPLYKATALMFSPCCLKEFLFATKEFGFGNKKGEVLKKIFIYQYISILLEKNFKNINNNMKNTICYSYWMSEGAYFLSKLKKKNKYALLMSRAHGGDCFIERGYLPFRREILGNLDEIHIISQAGKESIEKNLLPYVLGRNHCKLFVSRLGVEKINSKMCQNSDGSIFYIVSCSNIIPLKRLDILINAISEIKSLKINWVHFGTGSQKDEIFNLAKKKLSLKKNVEYHFFGYVPKKKILHYYEENPVDIFVNCSDTEGVPVSIMEAFSYGIPAIARNVGGNSEIIVDGENGYLLNSCADFVELAKRINSYSSLSKECKYNMRLNAYQIFSEKYNAENNYKIFCKNIIKSSTKNLNLLR